LEHKILHRVAVENRIRYFIESLEVNGEVFEGEEEAKGSI